mmetsp:Transcript_34469/g.79829  ORF Transcript_34469/g.79829 Transcript_34469/m.79829 type:complete len:222 (-) Transcript_34469:415-1080(-)
MLPAMALPPPRPATATMRPRRRPRAPPNYHRLTTFFGASRRRASGQTRRSSWPVQTGSAARPVGPGPKWTPRAGGAAEQEPAEQEPESKAKAWTGRRSGGRPSKSSGRWPRARGSARPGGPQCWTRRNRARVHRHLLSRPPARLRRPLQARRQVKPRPSQRPPEPPPRPARAGAAPASTWSISSSPPPPPPPPPPPRRILRTAVSEASPPRRAPLRREAPK